MRKRVVIGLDVGTGGVRGVAADGSGAILAALERALSPPRSRAEGWREQDPEDWWGRTVEVLHGLRSKLADSEIVSVCADGTSGTLVVTDERLRPLRDAILYNDARAGAEAEELNRLPASSALARHLGYRFNSSFAAAKALWIVRHESPLPAGVRFLNAADFISARLTGGPVCTDHTNALKMGYDLVAGRWPSWLSDLGVDLHRLPAVFPSGEVVGVVAKSVAGKAGIPAGVRVVIGPTDGVAAFYASGARLPGEAVTSLGTTLVVKSVVRSLLRDPAGRAYCHRHSEGYWLPGGASNCGCGYAAGFFPEADAATLDRAAAAYLPCEVLLYPLPGRGERFPFLDPSARRVANREPRSEAEHFAAYLQGVAFVERWAYEILRDLGAEIRGPVYTSGGGSRSDLWMQLRADVLGREVVRTASPDPSFGSAVLAASRTIFDSTTAASAAMVRVERRFPPRPDVHRSYEGLYRQFRDWLAGLGAG